MKALTAAAQANLDSGATSGPGTLICARCGGDKPEARINSSGCGLCRASKREEAPAMRSVRTSLRHDDFVTLEEYAVKRGITLASLAREVLADYAVDIRLEDKHSDGYARGNAVSPKRVEVDPSPAQWATLVAWVRDERNDKAASRRVLSTMTDPGGSKSPANRRRAYAAYLDEV